MNWKPYLLIFVFVGLSACGGSDGPGEDPDPEPIAVPPPAAATLLFPDNDEECNDGDIVNENQSRVTFQWNESQNTDSYEVNLTNLNTNNTSRTNSNTNSATILLERGTPYQWFVVSRANGTVETATSATWRFFNAGPGVENYAPFPAIAVFPVRGSSITTAGTVTLEWEGSDVDNDIASYDVLFGTDEQALSNIGTTEEITFETTVSPNTLYYWRIVTRDSQGNTSQSEVFEFFNN